VKNNNVVNLDVLTLIGLMINDIKPYKRKARWSKMRDERRPEAE
jgi:hypothetical protein